MQTTQANVTTTSQLGKRQRFLDKLGMTTMEGVQ